MSKIYEYFGFVFYFYSNEHEPIHVHVKKGGNESIFELILNNGNVVEIRQRNSNIHSSLSEKEAKQVTDFIKSYSQNIINKWINCFVLKKQVRNTVITKKLKS